jgi:hypothetical protein
MPIDRETYKISVQKQIQALANAKNVPPPKGSEVGLLSDFEESSATVRFGSGWSVSSDSLIGGKSKAEFKMVPGGATGSKGSMLVSGTIDAKATQAWAGVMFSPGAFPMSPANLSAKKAVSFWAKGEGKPANVMLFFQANGYTPAVKRFEAGKEWKRHRFELSEFSGCDGSGLMGVFFGGTPVPGPFSFQIDEVRFE